MKEKKELLGQIMTALAKKEQAKADEFLKEFLEKVSQITTEELTEVAQKLEEENVFADATQHANIERAVFEIIRDKIPKKELSEFSPGHPIRTFLEENREIKQLNERANKLLEKENGFTDLYSDWALLAKQFLKLNIHYLRKENQLFPYLEQNGFSHPSSIMWSLHDEIRKLAKNFNKEILAKDETKAKEILPKLIREASEMIVKEEKVLLPTAARLLSNEEWIEIRKGEDEIGWIVPEPPKVWNVRVSMDKHLKSDPSRIALILDIINKFFQGVELEALQKEFNSKLGGSLTPSEFALAEQKMEDLGVDNSQFEEKIDNLLMVFKKSLEKATIGDLEEGHPLDTFIRGNKAIQKLVNELREADKNVDLANIDHEYWTKAYEKLWQVNTHYLRKENQLFPSLETKGFDKPSTVMWAMHDDIRKIIKNFRKLLDEKKYENFFHVQEKVFKAIEGMIFKEEKILWPTSLELIDTPEWISIRKGEDEVGYCLIEIPPMWNPDWKHPSEAETSGTIANNAVAPVPFTASSSSSSSVGGINLEVGSITPEQINLIFKHLPFDVTYVDENDTVRYYNKGENRVFPRSPGIIGRQVRYCHPPKSVHIVEKIVAAFKAGTKSEANFWITMQGKFIYIQYFAVRDDNGNYKGVLEITYDAKEVRGLEGEQRLLDWE